MFGKVYLPYIKFSIFMGNVGFFSNAFFGFILVFLTLCHISRQFGSYKYLLVNFQVLGFIFATFEYLFHTFLHTYNASLIYFSFSRPLGLSNFTMEWMMGIYTGLYSATICQLAIQFIYRYWALFDTPKIKYFHGWYYLIWVSYYCTHDTPPSDECIGGVGKVLLKAQKESRWTTTNNLHISNLSHTGLEKYSPDRHPSVLVAYTLLRIHLLRPVYTIRVPIQIRTNTSTQS
ncbi:Serpentine Receptor, class T [Caenorhabditis elegans]|uniref:Serpentine Receptor, class T n=1 Tax=Caenorhabditis elegans TaxID=6239 RepID=O45801_CAEEL|nr:Serpentine Receptor, class T [Caenorhabditis elegans]CAB04813.2 Serpentine Receptor, class T [Caenorhabditis elegans]|eukprot:NP_506921.2 Uncharacterized protein CELE_T23D5.8 [Caenorhabditis elegans]